ncbi:kinase-like domain-containing protein [Multifurca ochricompacta]|uniref:Kinase-like domain-containing protein n=1 Tax=Multifurca ochricompacta TaxID=376703 RepID=A0AAD4LZ14_9AGAM|nr:kinase-like domain-containing protein [Multifurca ochricompacta]
MSTFWLKRKARLGTLLQSNGDEDEDGLALDRILHGQSVIAKTARTIEVDRLRFTDKDLTVIGTLEYGQLSVTDVVNCNIDGRLYVRKSIEKRFAFKSRDQCNPQLERDILLRALCTDSVWAPHLLCAFQTGTHLNLVMDYAEGGTLWDVLESNPLERICEVDLRWWLPQVISAVAWCHSQGFVHRDVKPHNFVLTRTAHVQLVDFGSAAPLVPGSRAVPPEYCRVPCGTCDYISPEILQAHEAALVAMEMPDNEDERQEENENAGEGGYGVETDWWSTGAMIYEMAYGVAPFFARDIRSTYLKIVDFRKSLTFHTNVSVSAELRDLLTQYVKMGLCLAYRISR